LIFEPKRSATGTTARATSAERSEKSIGSSIFAILDITASLSWAEILTVRDVHNIQRDSAVERSRVLIGDAQFLDAGLAVSPLLQPGNAVGYDSEAA
jgi:hypothetical protein